MKHDEKKIEELINKLDISDINYSEYLIKEYAEHMVQQERKKHKKVYQWLLGEKGNFPDLSQKPHYRFRTELRERIKAINQEDHE